MVWQKLQHKSEANMAKYSKMMMGKEVGDAKVYAPPHTMKGEKVAAKENPGSGKNLSRADTVEMTVGNINKKCRSGRCGVCECYAIAISYKSALKHLTRHTINCHRIFLDLIFS